MERIRSVGVAVIGGAGYARDILTGIGQYAGPDKHYSVRHVDPRELTAASAVSLPVDGLIAQVSLIHGLDKAGSLPFPLINVPTAQPSVPFPGVFTDDEAIGAMAAEHFLERGHTDFAMVRMAADAYSPPREKGFTRRLLTAGRVPSVFPPRDDGSVTLTHGDLLLNPAMPVASWLRALPKPIGVFAVSDTLGCWLIDLCALMGLHVPEEIAIVGVDNSSIETALCWPHLSSVDPGFRRIGHEAARMLDTVMAGRRLATTHKRVPPVGLVIRGSSDSYAVQDRRVAGALRYIRDHAVDKPTMKKVARAVGLPAHSLDYAFRTQFGRTVHKQVQHVRLEMVADMLRQTELPPAEIAARLNFSSQQYMTTVFRHAFGLPPGRYRARHRR